MPKIDEAEQDLIDRANQGDQDAFWQLYTLHREWVVALAYSFTRNQVDAQDILQETFFYFFKKFPGFKLKTNLRGFLYPVVRNLSFSSLRQRRRKLRLEEKLNDPTIQESQSTPSSFYRLVAGLEEIHQEMIVLRFGLQLGLSEIAKTMGLPLGTVKSRLHNALKQLRKNSFKKNRS